jgi:uncharacterized protein YdhG (YjbR/CyaY superfamily)
MKANPIDRYLVPLAPKQRECLQRLRQTIHSAAPGAEEVLSYRIPTIRRDGGLVAFAAFKDHCSLYVMSYAVLKKFRRELAPYMSGKATIRFTPTAPLPAALVRKLVRARLAENAARRRLSARSQHSRPSR